MNIDTVLVTGAAGGIGRIVVDKLADDGYRVVAVDRVPFEEPRAARCFVADLQDPEAVADCFAPNAADPDGVRIDAVVHLAAIPSPRQLSEHETLAQNTLVSYLVLSEAARRGVARIVVASSLAAVGIAWADRDLSPLYLPVDEEHPIVAVDSYGLSKVFTEQIAAFVTRRWSVPTVCLRLPFVGDGARLADRLEEIHANTADNRRELWGWIDTRDVARAVVAALTTDLTGHHVINIVAPDTVAYEPTEELIAVHYASAERRGALAEHASLYDTTRSRELLGFEARYGWREA
jgi:nucleoside-diphosphate-sugar epimerase